MGRLGTDVLALTCIMGGAAVGGVVTLAALEARGGGVEGQETCAEAVSVSEVTILRDGGRVRVRPARAPRVHRHESCASPKVMIFQMGQDVDAVRSREVRARIEEARRRAEEARVRAEEARARIEVRRERLETERLRAEALREKALADFVRQREELRRKNGGGD